MVSRKSIVAAAIVLVVAGGALAVVLAATPASSENTPWGKPSSFDLSQVVKLGKPARVADKYGDSIRVESVRGPSSRITAGNTYEVSGIYRLASANHATITAGVSECSCAGTDVEPGTKPISVTRGEGHFKFYFHDYRGGRPHVTLTALPSGVPDLWLYYQTDPGPQLPACCAGAKPYKHVFGRPTSASR